MKQKQFNIFEILSKDDKELSHSSMIKFLLHQDRLFANNLIGQENDNLDIHLEYKLDKKLRLDIIVFNGNEIVAIENKFKTLPQIEQLNLYTQKLSEKFKGRQVKKYLLYFEKGNDFNLPDDWEKITYEDVYQLIQTYLENSKIENDKEVLLKHYSNSLKEYINRYKELKNPNSNYLREIFINTKHQNNRFWLHLIFHELASLFSKDNFRTWVGSGSTYKPLINIHVPKWDFYSEGGYEFVVQLNGRSLKYYAHLKGLPNKQQVIDEEKKRLDSNGFIKSDSGKFKGILSANSDTSYVYQEDLIKVIESNGSLVSLVTIKDAIEKLIKKIENREK